jgi:DNA-directed RNA polymerase specialized sigma24 family protein/tetratricopeptide (TPR) repeat protein
MIDKDRHPDLTELASRAKAGDVCAGNELARRLTTLAFQTLASKAARNRPDAEDVVQNAVIEFLTKWDPTRSSAHYFFLHFCLRKHLARSAEQARREADLRSGLEDGAGTASPPEVPPADTIAGPDDLDLLSRLTSPRSPLLSEAEQELLRFRIEHPDWSGRALSRAAGLTEAGVSVLMHQKVPLELMRVWALGRDAAVNQALAKLVARVDAWQRAGHYGLAGKGATLLLSGFAPAGPARGVGLVDERGDPYLLRLLEKRSQIALAEQDLGYADQLLAEFEGAIRIPEVPDRPKWVHRLMVSRGRAETAAFRYGGAAHVYSRLLTEVPAGVWRRDPVFLHSHAVAHRGVGDYRRADDWIRHALEVYEIQGRDVDAAHTVSRRARILIEEGEAAHAYAPLEAAEELLHGLGARLPALQAESPMAHVQISLHTLILHGALGRDPEQVRGLIESTNRLINQWSYAHEFLELEEVFERYHFDRAFKDAVVPVFKPPRPRFGQKLLRSVRRRKAAGR